MPTLRIGVHSVSGTWGIPYQGSKNGIAEDIIRELPDGNRFIDLFGGGFAMSHCACYSNKYKEVVYNELNPLLPSLIQKAIDGYYDYSNFKPEFIEREKFHSLKEKDGYIKYIWSFSNSGKEYLYGKKIEKYKKSIHNWVVFDIKDEWFQKWFYDVDKYIKTKDIKGRRLLWKKYIETIKKQRGDSFRIINLEELERLQNLQALQQLEHFQRLERLQIQQGDYRDYVYQDGDIVYCDPPYEDTASYEIIFNHQEFYEWLISRPYKVYFSSYNNIKDKFEMVWAENKRNQMSGASRKYNYECLYINKGAKK